MLIEHGGSGVVGERVVHRGCGYRLRELRPLSFGGYGNANGWPLRNPVPQDLIPPLDADPPHHPER